MTINLQTSRAFYLKLTPNCKEIEDFLKRKVESGELSWALGKRYGMNGRMSFHPTNIIDAMSEKDFTEMDTFDKAGSYEFWFADLDSCILTVECDGKETVYQNEKIKARPFGPLSKPVTKYKWMEKTGGSDEDWSRRCDIIDKDLALKSDDKEFKAVMKYLQKCQDTDTQPEHRYPFTVLYMIERMKNKIAALKTKKNNPFEECEIKDDFLYMRAVSGLKLTASIDVELEEEFNISKFRVVRDKKWFGRFKAMEDCGFDFQAADVLTNFFIYDNQVYNADRLYVGINESLFSSADLDEGNSKMIAKTVDLDLRTVSK